MYSKKLEYLHSKYSEDKCISGIVTALADNVVIGTPGMVSIDPFTILGSANTFGSGRPVYKHMEPIPSPSVQKKEPKKKTTATKLRKLAEEDIREANRVMHTSLNKISVFIPFSMHNNTTDYGQRVSNSKHFYINGSKPLIFDSCKSMTAESLSDIHSKSEIANFHDILVEYLKEDRYVNYTFINLAQSNRRYIMADLNTVYNTLSKVYEYKISTFQFPGDRLNSVLDVMSISFYKIKDVIPIFDIRRSDGICMEIFATSSSMHGSRLLSDYNSATFRIIFARSKENIFTIDGEMIQRPCDARATDVIKRVSDMIARGVPNDKNMKKSSKSAGGI